MKVKFKRQWKVETIIKYMNAMKPTDLCVDFTGVPNASSKSAVLHERMEVALDRMGLTANSSTRKGTDGVHEEYYSNIRTTVQLPEYIAMSPSLGEITIKAIRDKVVPVLANLWRIDLPRTEENKAMLLAALDSINHLRNYTVQEQGGRVSALEFDYGVTS